MKTSAGKRAKIITLVGVGFLAMVSSDCVRAAEQPQSKSFEPFVWPSKPPADCPFEQSKDLVAILFTGVHSDYKVADT